MGIKPSIIPDNRVSTIKLFVRMKEKLVIIFLGSNLRDRRDSNPQLPP